MKTVTFVIGLTLAAAALVPGQKLDLKLPPSLAANASEKAEINLDADTLAAGKGLVSGAVPKDLLSKLQGVKEVHVYTYEFEKKGQYSMQDLEPLRKQVGPGTGWSTIVTVKEKEESVDIMVYKQGDKVAGFLLIAAEAKELAIIHVVGEMSLAKLNELVHSTVAYDLNSAKAKKQ